MFEIFALLDQYLACKPHRCMLSKISVKNKKQKNKKERGVGGGGGGGGNFRYFTKQSVPTNHLIIIPGSHSTSNFLRLNGLGNKRLSEHSRRKH